MLLNKPNIGHLFHQIKFFIILVVAVLRRSGLRLHRTHHRITAPGQHSFFPKNFAAVARR